MDTFVSPKGHGGADHGGGGLVPTGRLRLGEVLVQLGLATAEQVEQGMAAAERTGRKIGDCLVSAGHISRADLFQALGRQGTMLTAERLQQLPDWDGLITGKLGSGDRDEDVAFIIYTHDPRKRAFAIMRSGTPRSRMLPYAAEVGRQGYSIAGEILVNPELMGVLFAQWDSRSGGEAATVSKSELQSEFDTMVYEAYRMGASDIHISASRGRAQIHYRVHGELELVRDLTEEYATELCSAIYNTLSERGSTKEGFNPRQTQDAVIERQFPEGMIRFRYSGLPLAPVGFDVTLRIIPIGVATRRKEMQELGYAPDQCELLERIFSYTSGMILFAGTTGSGKSTSMANMLEKIAEERPGKKIRTVEEPVEYRIPGAYQTPVTRVHGDSRDFLVVLRQIMRSDPDIIMVGEVRDKDTADLAIQAVRSGHLCVSTIHANDAPVCYDRLVGMGINRLDLASVGLVGALIYQKLVPVLCSRCKVAATDIERDGGPTFTAVLRRVRAVNGGSLDGVYFRHEGGCEHCGKRGITGRTVCAEILRPTPEMLEAIGTGASRRLWELWRAQISTTDPHAMLGRTAFEHAIWKMRAGIVSPLAVEGEFRYLDETPWEGGA